MASGVRAKRRTRTSPIGNSHRDAMRRRAQRSKEYRDEYQRVAPYERIARMVIMRRAALGLSQKELALRMGTSHSAVSRIESGQHPTTVETLRRLAAALDTNLVVGFSDHEPSANEETDLVTVG
jgi:ribosome-binding protein aMBF1 (putative translation factor)